MPTNQLIFLDTEFTSFDSPALISIGLAATSGEEFYAEVAPLPEAPMSTFVRDVVIPLLDNNPQVRCPIDELHIRIRHWLVVVQNSPEITICFDSHYDEVLFKAIFDGHPPRHLRFRNVYRNIVELLRHDFHKKNSLPEHHALNDARGLRYAFRESVKYRVT